MEERWHLTECPNCGAIDWEEFEKPHGDPWYKCRECDNEARAIEIEVCGSITI